MASRSSVEKITCVCGEVVLSCRNRKVVLAGKLDVGDIKKAERSSGNGLELFNYLFIFFFYLFS